VTESRTLSAGWTLSATLLAGAVMLIVYGYDGHTFGWALPLSAAVTAVIGAILFGHVTHNRHDEQRRLNRHIDELRDRIDGLKQQSHELQIQLRLSEAQQQRMSAFLSVVTEAVLVTDAFGEVVLANKTAGRMLGFEPRLAVREPIDRVLRHEALVKLIKDICEIGARTTQPQRREVELRISHGEGVSICDVIVATFRTAPAHGNAQMDERSIGVLTVLRDVTREKEIAQLKSDFVSSVSHELRTPLASIKAYMEMLIDGEAPNEKARREFYHIVEGESDRLSRLIENLLNVSRIESGAVAMQRENIAVMSIVRDVLSVMKPHAIGRQVELSADAAPDSIRVFADRDMLYQAFLNLVSNAIKYTPSGGHIYVEPVCDRVSGMVHIRFRDTGVGIPPQDVPRLFDKFFRVADHRKMADGTGLGLPLVKHIIETVHGGKVAVQSVPNQGTTFTLSLPMTENDYEADSCPSPAGIDPLNGVGDMGVVS